MQKADGNRSTTPEAEQAPLLVSIEEGIARLTLNRPKQFNALSEELLTALLEQLDRIAAEPGVRVVVLAGNGRAFCAGHDLKQMRAHRDKGYFHDLFSLCGEMMTRIIHLPQPVIARVHGVATAAGCQLVASCDLAVAAETARFAVSGIKVGLFCSTPSVALARNLGRKRALEMLLTGEFIDAAQAAREGLVNRCVPSDRLDLEIDRLCQSICANPDPAIRAGKQLFYRQLEMGLDEAYQTAVEAMACNMLFEDTGEGIDAFMERREPRWKNR